MRTGHQAIAAALAAGCAPAGDVGEEGGAAAGGHGGSHGAHGGHAHDLGCASACAKLVALGCPAGPTDAPSCEARCAADEAACAEVPQVFQLYLECVDTFDVACDAATGAATSPYCAELRLAPPSCAG